MCDPPAPEGNRELVMVAKAEVARFEDYFQRPDRGGTSLTPMERELLTSYVFAKLTEQA